MNKFVLLLRGINVGGRNLLPMKSLVELLTGLGFTNVKTYIQSGNVVFSGSEGDAGKITKRIREAVKSEFDLDPLMMLIEQSGFQNAIDNNPFKEAEADPKSLHLGFLSEEPAAPDMDKIAGLKKDSESCKLIGNVFYLHAPEGIGRSKLAASSERLLGVSMTDRNWKTVCSIRDLLHS